MGAGIRTITRLINGATATTESGWIPVDGAKAVQFYFKRSNHSSGSTAFTVNLSPDNGTTEVAYNKLITNVTNTNAQQLTRVASVSLSSNTVSVVSMSPEDIGGYVQVVATETTDGTHDAWIVVSY